MVRAKGMGYRVAEVPISFVDRGKTAAQGSPDVQAADNLKFTESRSSAEMRSLSMRR